MAVTALAALAVVAASVPGTGRTVRSLFASSDVGVITYTVKKAKLPVTVKEKGNLESSENQDVFNGVEGSTTIIMILPEGTRVTKGQVVCELDSAALKDNLTNQRITTQGAESSYKNAKLAREIAEIAVTEYEQGIYVSERESLEGDIARAQSALKKRERRLERNRTARGQIQEILRQEGRPKTPSDVLAEIDIEDRVDTAEAAFQREQQTLEHAQTKLSVLQKYTNPKTVKELEIEVEKRRADERAKEAALGLEAQKEKKLVAQVAMCTLRAPAEGVVLYSNSPPSPRFRRAPEIDEGDTVRERQMIFSILDLNKPLRANVKIHEAWVDKIQNGQKAAIKIDAFPGKTFQGIVESVAPLPDPTADSFRKQIKVYTTLVRLEKGSRGLRPGMTADIEILAAERDDVLSVPIQAVVQYGGKDHVLVRKPSGELDWRDVNFGMSNGKMIEVKSGLEADDRVVLQPLSLMSEAEKRERFDKLAPPESAPAVPK